MEGTQRHSKGLFKLCHRTNIGSLRAFFSVSLAHVGLKSELARDKNEGSSERSHGEREGRPACAARSLCGRCTDVLVNGDEGTRGGVLGARDLAESGTTGH